MAPIETASTKSLSPPRHSKSKGSGFRWKDKPRRGEGDENGRENDGRLQRGYRHERDGHRDRGEPTKEEIEVTERPRRKRDETDEEKVARKARKRERGQVGEAEDAREMLEQTTSARESVVTAPRPTPANANSKLDDDIAAKFGPGARVEPTSNATKPPGETGAPPPRAAPEARSRGPGGPMIIVKINDRLGTTSKIPCLASDTVGDFKKMVAMRIGRKPHEIMLKRQSERPFKDFLTLEDYGVSDGVQLDLELDTGD